MTHEETFFRLSHSFTIVFFWLYRQSEVILQIDIGLKVSSTAFNQKQVLLQFQSEEYKSTKVNKNLAESITFFRFQASGTGWQNFGGLKIQEIVAELFFSF